MTTLFFCILWIALLLLACVLAGFMIHRRGKEGIRFAILAIGGVLLCWSFVSAGIGWQEIEGYTNDLPFMISILVGLVGLVCLLASLPGLFRQHDDRPPAMPMPKPKEKDGK